MTGRRTVRSTAGIVAAFAIAFFATALARRKTPSPLPADASARAAQLRAREETLAREVAALRQESPIEPAAAAPVPAPEAWNAAIRREYDIRVRAMVVKKMRRARQELGLTEAQLATYALRLREAAQRDPMLALGEWDKSDPEALVPLLDSQQHVRYLEKVRKGVAEEAQSETQVLARTLSANSATAGLVHRMLREEGVVHRDVLLTYFDRPREARGLLDKSVAAMDRVRVRVRPLMSPEEYEKLERHLTDEAGAMDVFVEEIQRAALKD